MYFKCIFSLKVIWLSTSVSSETLEEVRWYSRLSPNGFFFHPCCNNCCYRCYSELILFQSTLLKVWLDTTFCMKSARSVVFNNFCTIDRLGTHCWYFPPSQYPVCPALCMDLNMNVLDFSPPSSLAQITTNKKASKRKKNSCVWK